MHDTPKKQAAEPSDKPAKRSMFKRLADRLDATLKQKADEKAKQGSCCCGPGDKGSPCC